MAAKPFIKWVGGKGQLLDQLFALLPEELAKRDSFVYVEPFVGGGAMLFQMLSLYPNIQRAVINDLNGDLTAVYEVVRDKPEQLINSLRDLQSEYRACKSEDERRADCVTTARYWLRQRGPHFMKCGPRVDPHIAISGLGRWAHALWKRVQGLAFS